MNAKLTVPKDRASPMLVRERYEGKIGWLASTGTAGKYNLKRPQRVTGDSMLHRRRQYRASNDVSPVLNWRSQAPLIVLTANGSRRNQSALQSLS